MTSPFTFLNTSTATFGTGSSTAIVTLPSLTVGDLMISAVGYQGVAAGSGPFVTGSNTGGRGWSRLLYCDSGTTGSAIEVLCAYFGAGGTIGWNFSTSLAYVMRVSCYTNARRTNDYANQYGEPPITGVNIGNYVTDMAAPVTKTVTGSNPGSGTRYSYPDELLIVVAANQLASPGYGNAPAPWSKRFDNTAGGAFGTTELALADRNIAAEGNQSMAYTATASPAGQHGCVAIFGVPPPPRRYPVSHPVTAVL